MFRTTRPRWAITVAAVPALVAPLIAVAGPTPAAASPVTEITSSWTSEDGTVFTITNHLLDIPRVTSGLTGGVPHEYMVVWAGDVNGADLETGHRGELEDVPGFVGEESNDSQGRPTTPAVGPDFLAVIDVQKGTPTYGKVVNTVTMPLAENEPHHMQYAWRKGHSLFAGGLYSDVAFALDVTNIPVMTLRGINLPTDTPCGSVPDAFWVLKDGTAYGTWMGGPNLPGPCVYSNGEIRMGNGFGGSPGSLVYLDENGATISESPAATPGREPRPSECAMTPPVEPASCANPHGIQVREDLDRLVTGDFAQPSVIIEDPLPALPPLDVNMVRRTVRIWDISDRAAPKVVSVSRLPDGPRPTANPHHAENLGFMEVTVTNLPGHRGAFASMGTSTDELIPAERRPGAPGRWAVVNLPAGDSTLFLVQGERTTTLLLDADPAARELPGITGPQGPECLTAVAASAIAHGAIPAHCPDQQLSAADRAALVAVVRSLAERGVPGIRLAGGNSPRAVAAEAAVRAAADRTGIPVDGAADPRDARIVVGDWTMAEQALITQTRHPATSGVYLAPWLANGTLLGYSTGAVVVLNYDTTAGHAPDYIVALDSAADRMLASPAGFEAWLTATEQSIPTGPARLYAALAGFSVMGVDTHLHAMHDTDSWSSTGGWIDDGRLTPVSKALNPPPQRGNS